MEKEIRGKIAKDDNFIRVYCIEENRLYEISRVTGEWASVAVGARTYGGPPLTQEYFDKKAAECEKYGRIILDL